MPILPDNDFRKLPTPQWLSGDWPVISNLFTIENVLEDSLYYPASGTDGLPVALLSGFAHSFIYVDYAIESEELERKISNGFIGYHMIGSRRINKEDLTRAGWASSIRQNELNERERDRLLNLNIDISKAYALWAVFERDSDRSDDWGAKRFSLLYLYADGVATYEALYSARNLAPKVLCMLRPGTGFGGNWTDFYDPTAIFHRLVMERAIGPHPTFIMTDEVGPPAESAPWPEFKPYGEETENGGDQRHLRMWKSST